MLCNIINLHKNPQNIMSIYPKLIEYYKKIIHYRLTGKVTLENGEYSSDNKTIQGIEVRKYFKLINQYSHIISNTEQYYRNKPQELHKNMSDHLNQLFLKIKDVILYDSHAKLDYDKQYDPLDDLMMAVNTERIESMGHTEESIGKLYEAYDIPGTPIMAAVPSIVGIIKIANPKEAQYGEAQQGQEAEADQEAQYGKIRDAQEADKEFYSPIEKWPGNAPGNVPGKHSFKQFFIPPLNALHKKWSKPPKIPYEHQDLLTVRYKHSDLLDFRPFIKRLEWLDKLKRFPKPKKKREKDVYYLKTSPSNDGRRAPQYFDVDAGSTYGITNLHGNSIKDAVLMEFKRYYEKNKAVFDDYYAKKTTEVGDEFFNFSKITSDGKEISLKFKTLVNVHSLLTKIDFFGRGERKNTLQYIEKLGNNKDVDISQKGEVSQDQFRSIVTRFTDDTSYYDDENSSDADERKHDSDKNLSSDEDEGEYDTDENLSSDAAKARTTQDMKKGGIKKHYHPRPSSYSVKDRMLPSTKDLMYAYMKVMEFHCSSYPHFKAVEKKYKDIIKQIDEARQDFMNNKNEYNMYIGYAKNEYFRNVLRAKFLEFHKYVIPVFSIEHFKIPIKGPQNKHGGASWNVAGTSAKPITDYDYSRFNPKPPVLATMKLDPSIQEQITGSSECVIC